MTYSFSLDVPILAYLAGILDGEGTIVLNRRARSSNKIAGYCLQVVISNTDDKLIDYLEDLGFKIYMHEHKDHPTWKVSKRATLTTLKAQAFLQAVLPYLIVKKEQAEIGIAFQSTFSLRMKRYTSEQIAHKQSLYDKLRIANKKGR